MGFGLLKLDENSEVFNGSHYRRILLASITSYLWYINGHRIYLTQKQITRSLPAIFFLTFYFTKGLVMQYQAFNYKINEYDNMRNENLKTLANREFRKIY